MDLINEQFRKAMKVNRSDLIFPTAGKSKKKKNVISPLVINYNPGNPPFKKRIREELVIHHREPEVKKVFPTIDVVTRQTKSIKQRIIRSRYEKKENSLPLPSPPVGNYVLHTNRCKCCERMEDGKTVYSVTKTGRSYKIKRHYTCKHTHLVYLVDCRICGAQYVGQTTKTMAYRHLRHRSEIKSNSDGQGAHFYRHAQEKGIDITQANQFEEIMKYFCLTIVGSVEANKPWSAKRLDELESNLQHRFMTLEKHGGMNLRDENKRKRKEIGL